MIVAVFDCNVVMSALGWRNESYQCFVTVARGRTRPCITNWIREEYRRTAAGMEVEEIFPRSPWPILDWFLSACQMIDPMPLRKQHSRDATDDAYLACALAAQAQFIITRDPDLIC